MVDKLYCYVDETGQDTEGKLFLVALVLKNIEGLPDLEHKLEEIEKRTGKKQFKWKKISHNVKRKYLEELIQIKELKNSIYYAIYQSSKEYSKLTSYTIAKSVLVRNSENYTVTVIIDGLNDKQRDVVRDELKKLKIKYRKIRGMKDEQSVFLRLSDSMVGFLREVSEGKSYSKQLMRKFKMVNIISEV